MSFQLLRIKKVNNMILYFLKIFIYGVVASQTKGSSDSLNFSVEDPSCSAYLSQLNEENRLLSEQLEFAKSENDELRFRLHSSSNCPCDPEGRFSEQDEQVSCPSCSCQDGVLQCYSMLDCPCLNGGTCISLEPLKCQCPHGFSGPLCEQTQCFPIQAENTCRPVKDSWYFDSRSNRCKPANSGCFDHRSTFDSHTLCSLHCLRGTCCYTKVWEASDGESICEVATLEKCQQMCYEATLDVVGFYPGILCPDEGCAFIATKTCHTGSALYSIGSKFSFGCDSCECLKEQISCRCNAVSMRREIRELSSAERLHYQRLVSMLQEGKEQSVWNSLRNLYAHHIMHANSPQHFLFWNRIFLRTLERHIQEFDCSASIPYVDVTLDAGHIASSVIWNPDYFGFLGNATHCQRHTIPHSQILWTPCITRNLASHNTLPSMIDTALALANTDFQDFSAALQSISNYVHSFIGGDMDTEGGPLDPFFYSFRAYIDQIFWQWQKRHSASLPEKILLSYVKPFSTQQRFLVDSERNLCVSYKPIGTQAHHSPSYGGVQENEIPLCSARDSCTTHTLLTAGSRVQSVLYQQPEEFLKSLPRTCSMSPDIPEESFNKFWNIDVQQFKVDYHPEVTLNGISDICKQFCFAADIFLTEDPMKETPCQSSQIPTCAATTISSCPYYGQVPCRISLCDDCSLICHINGQDVDCSETRHDCEIFGQLYQNNAEIPTPDPCERCYCHQGDIECESVRCPALSCDSATKLPGSCCPTCQTCHFQREIYQDGQVFQPVSDPCYSCICSKGSVQCELKEKCNPQCSHPAKFPHQCCPLCDGCQYRGSTYRNGELFQPDPNDTCRRCECSNGNVKCFQQPCPQVSCPSPIQLPTECCPKCLNVCYDEVSRKVYQDGDTWRHSDDACTTCTCKNSLTLCDKVPCPIPKCLHAAAPFGVCCRECEHCEFTRRLYRNGQEFTHEDDPCQRCICRNGTVSCEVVHCDPLFCAHPEELKGFCCPVCAPDDRCYYYGKTYEAWENFMDPKNACRECVCIESMVSCHPVLCLETDCPNPQLGECCHSCDGCSYEAKNYANHVSFLDPLDECRECECLNGVVECQIDLCRDCFYNDRVVKSGSRIEPDDADLCRECLCNDSEIQCHEKPCPEVYCKNPVMDDCCPVCNLGCSSNGTIYKSGENFDHPFDSCSECVCKGGDVMCDVKPCPNLSCSHPAFEECCLECENCVFLDEYYINGKSFSNPNDPCETCICLKGQVTCKRDPCVQCLHPLKIEGCCPVCNECFFKSKNYTSQEHFTDPDNPCQECICKSGTVTCHEISCSLPSCLHPVVHLGECCPRCTGCEVSGQLFDDNMEFTHPDDICKKCICKDSHLICTLEMCPLNCTHPLPDKCCPQCNDCLFEGIIYSNGEKFQPDPCRTCKCKDGSVTCTTAECTPLPCKLRYRPAGECCERCRGCVYEGKEYENEERWQTSSSPCLSCFCSGGTVSCQNVVCHIECSQPIPVPGLCCPICPECQRNNAHYKSGEIFVPEDDPCESCLCDSGNLFCIRRECPTLIGCPEEAIKPPSDGECCPSCAGFGTTCNRNQIGNQMYPTDDPCFSCECSNNFMWVCSKEICPALNCSSSQIIKLEDECCPKCRVCLWDGLRSHGESWLLPNDTCTECVCKYGMVECQKVTCPKLNCDISTEALRIPGECCPLCPNEWSCHYNAHHYEHAETWSPDPCTVCKCFRGQMQCVNERCLPLVCSSDEIQSLDPGRCCPRCMPQPATCIVYGDPHYRTFDGAAFSFQGTCRYVLTADCSTQKFNILVENNDRGFKGVSWTHRAVVVLQNASVDLRSGPTILVKGKEIQSLPYFDDPVLYVEKTGSSILVTTNVGVKVFWDGDGYLEVIVSGAYRGKTCGLCGNFNNFPQDDMRTPKNEMITSEAEFGNSWKNPGTQPEGCADSMDIDPCSIGGYRIRKMANAKCSIIKQNLFIPCHRFIPPEPYFAACVYDVCACSENDDCLCDILSAYSKECAKAGVIIHWRNEGLCGIHCSHEDGFFFDECGPPCPRTCENRNVPVGVLAAQCLKPCVPGCQCLADKVLYNGQCIRPNMCP